MGDGGGGLGCEVRGWGSGTAVSRGRMHEAPIVTLTVR